MQRNQEGKGVVQQIGRYRIIRELGRGGMATVYLAHDPRFQRDVAIKVLPHQFMHDPRFLERFEQEARTIAALEHFAIVPVYDFGEEDDAPYLVMRHMSGGSLRDRMGGEPLPLPETSRILGRLSKALDRAHEKGIIHRDLKPGNVIFDEEDLPYLADFGIARMAEATHTMTVVGTPGYMSPEQVQGQQKLDWRSDIYALGVMLFEILSGHQPYVAETPTGQMLMHILEPVPDVLAARPSLPPQTQAVIDKVMAKDREVRYQTAEALAQAVKQLLSAPPPVIEPPISLAMPVALETEAPVAPLQQSAGAAPFETSDKTTVDTAPEELLAAAAPISAVEDKRQDPSPAPLYSKPLSSKKQKASVPVWAWWVGAFVVIVPLLFILYTTTLGNNSKIPESTDILAEKITTAATVQEATAKPLEETTAELLEKATAEPVEEPSVGDQQAEVTRVENTQEQTTINLEQYTNCDNPPGCVVIPPDDPVLLASALIISGPNTELGLDSQFGVELALNFREEILGHPLALQAEDDGCSAEGGKNAANKIVSNPQVVAMIGTSCSGAGIPASKIISDAGYVMVSPSNTSPALTDPAQAFQEGYLRTSHNDLVQGRAMAEFAFNELDVTKAAAIHDGDPYTEGLASAFAGSFEELGGEVVAFEAEAPDASNVKPLLTTVAAAGLELIFYPVFIPLGSLITNTAKDVPGLEGVILAAADGIQSPSFLENTVGTSEGLYSSGPDLSFENAFYRDEFLPAYREEYGSDPTAPFHAHAFDATMIVLDAVEHVAQQEDDGTLIISRQALRDTLYSTSGYEGITGTLTCNEFGDCASAQPSISVVEGGEFVRIWP